LLEKKFNAAIPLSRANYRKWESVNKNKFMYSFICQGTLTKRQWSDLFGLRVKLSLLLPV